MIQDNQKEISLDQFKRVVKDYSSYLLRRWYIVLSVAILAGVLGIIKAWLQKPIYKAELVYAASVEGSNLGGGYSGLAAQFGLDVNTGGSVFEGDNLMQLLKSNLLLQKTFLTAVEINGRKELLINRFIQLNKITVKENNTSKMRLFTSNYTPGVRVKDSLLKQLCKQLVTSQLQIQKIDKKLDLVLVTLTDEDEFFAKNFTEQLVNNAIAYYTEYKIKKARQNVEILERQRDSLRGLIVGGITSIAVSHDLNVNPTRQVAQVSSQKKQVDIRVNSALYEELVKNLELSKLNLRRETPLIQVIDVPVFPLEKKKPGRLFTGLTFACIGGFLATLFFFLKRFLEL